jgi:predicted transcriptional regulator
MTDLRRLREASGVTQTKAAEIAGCSQPHLALCEAGKRRMDPCRETKLAAALAPLAEAQRIAEDLQLGRRIRAATERLVADLQSSSAGVLRGRIEEFNGPQREHAAVLEGRR